MTEIDGDLKVVCLKIDTLTIKVDRMDSKLEKNIEISSDRLRELEKHTALMEKGCVDGRDTLIKDIDELKAKSNRNDIFVVIGNMIVVAVASVANALGMRE